VSRYRHEPSTGIRARVPRWRSLPPELVTDKPAPYDEVAATTEIPRGNIGSCLCAIQRLRRMIDEHGPTEVDGVDNSPDGATPHPPHAGYAGREDTTE
jgi:hypothetical protein